MLLNVVCWDYRLTGERALAAHFPVLKVPSVSLVLLANNDFVPLREPLPLGASVTENSSIFKSSKADSFSAMTVAAICGIKGRVALTGCLCTIVGCGLGLGEKGVSNGGLREE